MRNLHETTSASFSGPLYEHFAPRGAHLSFTRAAREQFVTQSAISHSIRTLELQLGQALFHRVNRSLKLTHAGEALYRATDRRPRADRWHG